ncbi:hypothetical protein MTR_7g005220 [Medicago truncatula]|uniref:Uncharacterized protein n=1 Tax=Medicago truncatula TaxID=3880 RepID=G7KVL7_MEDTR|nr:hypothetical protein MTR_7g005220 [Medicago truncatula]
MKGQKKRNSLETMEIHLNQTIEEDSEVMLLVERSFVATGRVLIDMEMGELKLRWEDD